MKAEDQQRTINDNKTNNKDEKVTRKFFSSSVTSDSSEPTTKRLWFNRVFTKTNANIIVIGKT